MITFYPVINEGINEGTSGGTNEGTSEGINDLFRYIQNHEGLRVSQISKAIHIPPKTIERWITTLKADNKIEYRGSKKTGGYFALQL